MFETLNQFTNKDKRLEKRSQGIQSVEFAFELLDTFLQERTPMALGDAAKQLGIGKSKLHKYFTSFVRLGIIEQDSEGRYSFGSKLMELGLGVLGNTEIVSFCTPELHRLRLESGEATALAVWTAQGPTIVRFLESPQPITINMRVGYNAPLTTSAAGKCFAANLPEEAYSHLVDHEVGQDKAARELFESELLIIAAQGISLRRQAIHNMPGSKAMACPIIDGRGEIVASILLIGFEAMEDINLRDDAIELLKTSAQKLSAQLGHTKPV